MNKANQAADATPAAPDDTPAAAPPNYGFYSQLARIINSGQSRSILAWGNVHDLFYVADEPQGRYVPLVDFLCEKCDIAGLMLLVYELNGPIRFVQPGDRNRLRDAWIAWRSGMDIDELTWKAVADRGRKLQKDQLSARFDREMMDSVGKPTMALEFLRQLTLCSRSVNSKGNPYLDDNLLIIIEAGDLLLPAGGGNISQLNPADRRRVGIVQDWFSDPGLMNGGDSVVLLAESRGLIHPRVARLPQVLSVEVPDPDVDARRHYIADFIQQAASKGGAKATPLWSDSGDLATLSAGLSVHALRQMLIAASHSGPALTPGDVIAKVEEHICAQLGDDVVEFKKPEHTMDHVVGFTRLKEFLNEELLPRFQSSGPDALPGAAVAGPIGGGKTFIFEAVASALDLPVLVLKNIRSQWFGQTDVIFERLRRVLEALQKVVIFVDEADTQFGGVDASAHATERRLTGKIQQMMSDPKLRGRVIWLLMTARIHLLSPDIRRPGRVGDLIIPVLDPEGEDRRAFLRWVFKGVLAEEPDDAGLARLDKLTPGHSAAAFASLRSTLKAKSLDGPMSLDEVAAIVYDNIPPAIGRTRRYQTLQAMVNCTRRSLLPDPDVSDEERERWQTEIRELESQGIR